DRARPARIGEPQVVEVCFHRGGVWDADLDRNIRIRRAVAVVDADALSLAPRRVVPIGGRRTFPAIVGAPAIVRFVDEQTITVVPTDVPARCAAVVVIPLAGDVAVGSGECPRFAGTAGKGDIVSADICARGGECDLRPYGVGIGIDRSTS